MVDHYHFGGTCSLHLQGDITEDSNLHSHGCENHRSYIAILCVEATLHNIHRLETLFHPEDGDSKFA
jgi:hypothetical protein